MSVAQNPEMLQTLLRRCGNYLKVFALSECHLNCRCDHILPIVSQYCPNLETILLDGCSMASSSLRSVSVHCSKLKSVDLTLCFNDEFTDRELSYFVRDCSKLTSLDLRESREINGCFAFFLPSQFKRLSLDMRRLENEAIQVIIITHSIIFVSLFIF